MNVTLFCDASLCSRSGKGGWAAWLKSDEGTVRGSGPFRYKTIDTGIAEAMAAVNGIHLGLKRRLIRPGSRILLQTDNNTVEAILNGKVRRRVTRRALDREGADAVAIAIDVAARNALIEQIVMRYRAMVERYGLLIAWRHVKAHMPRNKDDKRYPDARSAVNNLCDRSARQHMKDLTGRKKGKKKPTSSQRKAAIRREMMRRETLRRDMASSNVIPFVPRGHAADVGTPAAAA